MRHTYPTSGAPVWIDLHNPTAADIDEACTECGLQIPTREQLDEIESSSRMRADGDTLTVSMPATPYHANMEPVSSPIGFVLTPGLLVTVRFDELHTFHKVGEKLHKSTAPFTSAQVFAELVEAVVDYSADKLELIKADTRRLSRKVFRRTPRERRTVARNNKALRETLVILGDTEERLSEIRETLLAMQRAVPFVSDRGAHWIGAEVSTRLKVAVADIQSLNDYETHLTDKVQFLLDATLGFISNAQNDIFKVLTIASIVGIPPTFVVGLYGMNFKNIPEFDWAYGYQWGLFLVVLSIIVPVGWFKWRGWW